MIPAKKLRQLLPLLTLPFVAMLATAVLYHQRDSSSILGSSGYGTTQGANASGVFSQLFTPRFPANQSFKDELSLMRATGKLTKSHEKVINRMVINTSGYLHLPPGVLWCLLFQESRLDHLKGLRARNGARGLGQFSYWGFQEINESLDRYDPTNLKTMVAVLGKDVRPVAPLPEQLSHPSSYFSIPTAVVSSAAYLNNRYYQLKRNLEHRGLKYSPDILWLYSAMAYNKGARSILSFWNVVREKRGLRSLENSLLTTKGFTEMVESRPLVEGALKRIWDDDTAVHYADELQVHTRRLQECSTRPNLGRN